MWNLSTFATGVLHVLVLLQQSGVMVEAATRMVVLDDTDPRIIYSTTPAWNQGNGCDACWAQPEPAAVHNRTWHDAMVSDDSQEIFFEFDFVGVGVDIRCIYIDMPVDWIHNTQVTITVDRNPSVPVSRAPVDSLDQYSLNQVLFNQQGLANEAHHVRVDLVYYSVLLLDAIFITEEFDESSSQSESSTTETSSSETSLPTIEGQSSKSNNAGAIAGGVVGGIAVITLFILAILLFYHRKKKQDNQPRQAIDPSIMEQRSPSTHIAPIPYSYNPYNQYPNETDGNHLAYGQPRSIGENYSTSGTGGGGTISSTAAAGVTSTVERSPNYPADTSQIRGSGLYSQAISPWAVGNRSNPDLEQPQSVIPPSSHPYNNVVNSYDWDKKSAPA